MPDLLEDDIRATAPQPDPQFVARLERRVETGFAKEAKPAKQSRWRLRPVLAGAVCTVLVGIFAATAILTQTQDSVTSFTSSESAQDSGGSAAQAPVPEVAPRAPSAAGDAVAPGSEPRKRDVRTSVDLTTPADEFSETTAGVLRVADRTGTIVQSSSVSESNGDDLARYDLRVPASKLDEVLSDLSELGDVTQRNQDVQDITASYVSARDRLEDARDVRQALLKALERADSEGERSAIRGRLNDARQQISAAEAEVRRVRARSDRATVDLTVRSTQESGAWMPADAFDDAVRILEVVAGVALVVLAFLLPFGILVLAGFGATKVTRRRRREAALG